MSSVIALIILKKVHALNVQAKREKVYTNNKITTRDTTFTDHFCPLTNVSREPNTSIFTAQITTENVGSRSSTAPHTYTQSEHSSNLNLPTSTATNSQATKFKNKFLRDLRRRHFSPIERFYKTVFPIFFEFAYMSLLFTCGTMWPSLLSTPYFLIFMLLLAKWSLTRSGAEDDKFDTFIKINLIFYLPFHLLVYFLYQLHLFQHYLSPDTFIARLVGFNQILYNECQRPAHLSFNPKLKWQQMTFPFVLFTLYWFLAVQFSYSREGSAFFELLSSATTTPTIPTVTVNRSPTHKKVSLF